MGRGPGTPYLVSLRIIALAENSNYRGDMANRTGVDPYDWPLNLFCDAVLAWARERVLHRKDGEHKWAEIENELWDGIDRSPADETREIEANATALAELGGPRGGR